MVVEEPKMNTKSSSFSGVGRTIKLALLKAQSESRVIVGLSDAIQILSKIPEGSLFCLLAQSNIGDSGMHMHEVLLEAFCYEHDIYVVKVDSAQKLSRILGKNTIETCALIQKTASALEVENNEDSLIYNNLENLLVDHCEAYWDAPQQPVIKLPEM